ncbi:hypothetical protein [Rhodoferax sp.]|uniref:hypothetical protein n=1 Tax=Rhodoferax sp. TaxID=50421 RepID=UPI0025CD4EC6|nr:hypothetical protein [Rhodoferax sp.]
MKSPSFQIIFQVTAPGGRHGQTLLTTLGQPSGIVCRESWIADASKRGQIALKAAKSRLHVG